MRTSKLLTSRCEISRDTSSKPHPTRQRSLVLAIGQQVEHPNAREPLRPERPRRALVRAPVTRPASQTNLTNHPSPWRENRRVRVGPDPGAERLRDVLEIPLDSKHAHRARAPRGLAGREERAVPVVVVAAAAAQPPFVEDGLGDPPAVDALPRSRHVHGARARRAARPPHERVLDRRVGVGDDQDAAPGGFVERPILGNEDVRESRATLAEPRGERALGFGGSCTNLGKQ